jgi:alanyl-tRNA synthetase
MNSHRSPSSGAAGSSVPVRAAFLDFFRQHGHAVVRSSPLVPSDPTLLFTNAGMVQFKDVFTGQKQVDYRRAATSQKCVRAGGKHNDLDNVGYTARHHTFFEMLGNFSFGDYFKADAIEFAWNLLHRELGLPKERLMFTVFKGEDGIPADEEARALWVKVTGMPESRVAGLGKKDNFWMMGDTGPQGPCSEIHFWVGEGEPDPSKIGDDTWLEIWNLVFMQFERREKDGPLLSLPAPSIDTGAGLERVCAVLGGLSTGHFSNYDTDLFMPLLNTVAAAVGKPYTRSMGETDVAMRVLADHSRATANLIADGVLPSNLGRGYVLRSIMRRAIRFAVRLGLPAGFFATLCGAVCDLLSDIYPELKKARSLIDKAVNAEDEGFRGTIHRGLRIIEDTSDWHKGQDGSRVLPGAVAFQLHDTFGFPLDLTQVIGREQGFSVDEVGFHAEMKKQRERSKFTGSGDHAVAAAYHAVRSAHGPTTFLGYDAGDGHNGAGRVLALFVAGESTARVDFGPGQPEEVEVIVDSTPFYGRSGGQVGDTGQIRLSGGGELEVTDTQKPLADLIVHRARIKSGGIAVGDEVTLHVDRERRGRTRRNHSATHLLHHALRGVLGEHVTQKGSYVGPDKLTFDFSHFQPLSADELRRVERLVNAAVRENVAARDEETSFDEAQRRGAMALFGEKYGDRVRMMHIGASLELCGGTHVGRSGDIGLFKIVSETGIAKGIRRIEALSGDGAEEFVARQQDELAQAAEALRSGPLEVAERVARLQEDLKAREKELQALQKKLATAGGSGLFAEEREVAGVKVTARRVDGADAKALREVAEEICQKSGGVVAIGTVIEGKAALVVALDKTLSGGGKLHAGKLVGALAVKVGGKGGGRPDIAQAGGSDADKLEDALRASFEAVAAVLA